MIFHALVDLSLLPAARAADVMVSLTAADQLTGLAQGVTCILPAGLSTPEAPHWRFHTAPGVDGARVALADAGRDRAHLLVLSAPVVAPAEAAIALAATFAVDPLFGAAHPRFSVDGGATVAPVFDTPTGDDGMPTSTLLDVPEHYLLPEHLSPCFVVRHDMLANIDTAELHADSVATLLFAYLRKARRVGFRHVVCNSVLVHAEPPHGKLLDSRVAAAASADIDSVFAYDYFARHDQLAREPRLAALHTAKPRVLIDARNLGVTINGTSKALLGLTDALYARRPGWTTTLAASRDASESHGLLGRYPDWSITHDVRRGDGYAVAFRPSQPWDLAELVDLHHTAALNVFLMLDTIAWDVVYTAPAQLDATWRFVAQYADALLFISDFSRQRFLTRFRTHPDVRAEVCHLSLDPADYVEATALDRRETAPFWFVVGNHYDHKHVQPTLALLSRAFPTTPLAVLGAAANGERVNGHTSGRLTEQHVQTLYAGAELVIFPSLYEGFGLPIVNALAYGRPVIARDSALLRELAAAYVGPGRLVPFTTPDELIERLMQLRRARPVPEYALRQDDATRHGWAAAAAIVESHLNELMRPRRTRRERDRHDMTQLLDEYVRTRSSHAD